MGLPRKIRRALQHDRERLGLPQAGPWTYSRELEERRHERAFTVELVKLAGKYRFDLRRVGQIVRELVTTALNASETVVES